MSLIRKTAAIWRERKIDPRVLQVVALACYAIAAREIYGFERTHLMTFTTVVIGVMLDLLIGRFYFKKVNVPYTPVIAALACSILLDSPYLSAYVAAVAFAILSKAFLLVDRRHIFNPGNFGAVIVLCFAADAVTGIPNLFSSYIYTPMFFFLAGSIVAAYARTFSIAAFWLVNFSAIAFLRSYLSGASLTAVFYPALVPSFILFTFHMITDPATTPRSMKGRYVFTLLVAIIDGLFRWNFQPYGNFFGLFLVSALYPLTRVLMQDPVNSLALKRLAFSYSCIVPLAIGAVFWREQGLSLLSLGNASGTSLSRATASDPADAAGVIFREIGESAGLTNVHVGPDADPRLKKILRMQFNSPGVAVADFDADGDMDVFVPNSRSGESRHSLYLNDLGKGFADRAKEWGIAEVHASIMTQGASAIDLDEDGRTDLILNGAGCTRVYRNEGTSFRDVTDSSGLGDCENSISTLPADFNGDGKIDLYVIRYFGPKVNLKSMGEHIREFAPNEWHRPTNGGINTVYLNEGNGKFRRAPEINPDEKPMWTYDAGIADIDGDGHLELVLANDFGPDQYFRLVGGKLVDISRSIAEYDRRSGMNVSFGHWDSERPTVYISNFYSRKYTSRANFVWEFDPKTRRLEGQEIERGAGICGWSWGAYFGDFDLDGRSDLYVTNGMVTRSKPEKANEQGDSAFFRLSQWHQIPLNAWDGDGLTVFNYLDLLTKDLAGHQRDCLFMRDRKSSRFVNVSGAQPGLDTWDGRGVAGLDYDQDGDIDLVVTAQESRPYLLENVSSSKGNWIGFDVNAPLASLVGAKFRLRQGEDVQWRWGTAGKTGYISYSDPRIHFGLKSTDPVSLEIIWPDGGKERFDGLEPGSYRVIKSRR